MGDHLEHAFLPGQQGLAPLQGRLGLLAILDVGRRARPVHEVSQLVAHRHRTEEAPAVRAIETSEAYFRLSRRSRGAEACPGLPQRPEVVGMNRSLPPPIEGLRQGEARIVEPALVEQGGSARAGMLSSIIPRCSLDACMASRACSHACHAWCCSVLLMIVPPSLLPAPRCAQQSSPPASVTERSE